MQITFLVGNGFDLNLGLATRFSDFLDTYCEKPLRGSENVKEFKKSILKEKSRWAYAELEFGKYTKVFQDNGKNADAFYECYDDFCVELAFYLESQEVRIDFSEREDFIAKAFSEAININNILNSFSEVQRNELSHGISMFGNGFTYSFIDFNYTTTLDQCVSATKKKADVLGTRIVGSTRYTNSISKVIHVHGYTSKSMVLGVNDDSQIDSIDLFKGYGEEYIDQLIKVRANALNEENTDKKAAKIVGDSDLIYIYGMSLGETDKLWWQRIIQRMLNNANVHLIIHSHVTPYGDLLPRRKRTWTNKLKNSFLANYDKELSDAERKSVLSRIHVDSANIFAQLIELKPDDDTQEDENKLVAANS